MVSGAVFSLFYVITNYSFKGIPSPVIQLGLAAGILFFIAVVTFFEVTRWGRLSISWTAVSLSLVIPTLASILFWKEKPSPSQIFGIIGVATALIMLGADRKQLEQKSSSTGSSVNLIWAVLLAVSFMATGLNMVCTKALIGKGLGAYILQFTFLDYLTASILAVPFMWGRNSFPGQRDLKVGLLMGVSGFVSFVLFLHALRLLSGVVVFPVRSMINILATIIFSVLLWQERIGTVGKFGILTAIVSIFLISLKRF